MNTIKIQALLIEHFDYYGAQINPKQIEMWANDLKSLQLNEIVQAISELQKQVDRSRPATPAQIRAICFGYPTPEEAWAMCPINEDDSVVWCDEVAIAYGAVRNLINSGDRVAARMGFLEVYEKEVNKSKALNLRPKFKPTFGFNKDSRDRALKEAVEKNRLSSELALSYSHSLQLPPPTRQQIASKQNLKLLTHTNPIDEEAPLTEEEKQKNLARIRDLLKTLDAKKIN